jgi:hypothetical protein
MRVPIILVLFFFATAFLSAQKQPETPSLGPFELESDKLGERLKTFVFNHPKAECTIPRKRGRIVIGGRTFQFLA